METILLIAALASILWVAIGLIGLDRVRQWLPWAERQPYVVDQYYMTHPENDPVIGEIFRAARDAGRNPGWFTVDVEQTKMREGFQLLRTKDGRRVIHRSKMLAHSEEIVLMALRANKSRKGRNK